MTDGAALFASLRPIDGTTPTERLTAMEPALLRWVDPDSPERRTLLDRLVGRSPFSEPMLRFGLDLQFDRVAPDALGRMIEERHPRLESGGGRRTVIVHAGAIPALAPLDVALSLLAGDVVVVKAPAGDAVTAPAFCEPFAGAAAVTWPGDDPRTRALIAASDHLLVYGGDAAVDAVLREAADRAVAAEGFRHRVGAAWVDGASLADPETAQRLAVDVAMWDQEGCLSPHWVFVESDGAAAAGLADGLATVLDRLDRRLPRGERTLDQKAALRSFHSAAEARRLVDPMVTVRAGDALEWIVVVDGGAPIAPSPLGRAIRIVPVARREEMFERLSPWRERIQCVGVAGKPSDPSWWREQLEALGATRLCRLGRMQEPGPAWIGEECGSGARRVAVELERAGSWQRLTEGREGR